MKTPSSDDLLIAAQWLDVYDGDDEDDACQRVRSWLIDQAENQDLRAACREAGVAVSQARKAMRASRGTP